MKAINLLIPMLLAACSSRPVSASGSNSSGSASSAAYLSNGISLISGIPYPPANNIAKPTGTPGILTVLNWAGFKAAVSYTFDDGQPSQIGNYPALQGEGVPLTFYVCGGLSGTSANFDSAWSQAVKDGHEIGNHTYHHPHADLSETGSFATQLAEIDSNENYIREHLGDSNIRSMAAPFGDTGWAQYAAQRYFLNRGVTGGTIAPNSGTDPFNLPVFAAVGGESASALNSYIDSTYSSGNWLIFLFHTLLPGASWYAPVDISSVTGSIDHAKAFGDLWIDTLTRVGAYWRAQKIFQSLTPVKTGTANTWSWTLPEHFPAGMYLRISVAGSAVMQGTNVLSWDPHGFYEISLDSGSLNVVF